MVYKAAIQNLGKHSFFFFKIYLHHPLYNVDHQIQQLYLEKKNNTSVNNNRIIAILITIIELQLGNHFSDNKIE